MENVVPGEVLNLARGLVESGWCQRAYCRSGMGREVSLRSPWAKCWCPSGAVWTAARKLGIDTKRHPAFRDSFSILVGLCRHRGFTRIGQELPDWNDVPERTREEVLALFDEAIRHACPFVFMPPSDPQ